MSHVMTLAVNDNRRFEPSWAPMNRVALAGRLCVDPVLSTTSGGRRIAQFSLMTANPSTCHQVVVAADHLVGFAVEKLREGSHVLLEGQLQTRRAEPSSAADLRETGSIVTEIVLLDHHACLSLLDTKPHVTRGMLRAFPDQVDPPGR